MKKILLSTSAIALAGVYAGQASAAEWNVDVGGYYETMIGFSDEEENAGEDFGGIDVVDDAEIIFNPSITLDNGLKFGADVQLEATSGDTGDRIDESFVFVSGSFGQILLGSENSAGYKMTYAAPDVSWIGVNSGSLTGFFGGDAINGVAFRSAFGSTFTEVAGNNDAKRITYFTPRFAGFQLGASYARDANEGGNNRTNNNANTSVHDIFDIGANYVNSFGGFDVALSGRYGTGDVDGAPATALVPAVTTVDSGGDTVTLVPAVAAVAAGSDSSPDTWAVGLNLGFGGITVGGSYANNDNDAGQERDGFDAGVSYETGPWGVSLTGSFFEEDNAGAADRELTQILGAVSYKVGPGVTAGAIVGYIDQEVDGGADADGFAVGAGVKLAF